MGNTILMPAGQLHTLGTIGLVIVVAMIAGRIANIFRLPRITGYLLLGLVLGPSVLDFLSEEVRTKDLSLITDIALSIIAFSIGGSIRISGLKKLGMKIFWVTISQGFAAFVVCSLALWGALVLFKPFGSMSLGMLFPFAILLGAIAVATAPGEILAIIHEYRPKGPFTETLLGVVALDDSITLILYAFAAATVKLYTAQASTTFATAFFEPLFTIGISVALGSAVGIVRKYLSLLFPDRESLFGVITGFLFLTTGLSYTFGGSPLLATMTLGFVVANVIENNETVFETFKEIEGPIFALFFALAGAHFDVRVFQVAGLFIVIFSFARFLGKYLGSWLGATVSKSAPSVKKYLGLALLPQAGVASGLVLNASVLFPNEEMAMLMVNIVVGSIIVNALLTPLLVHFALVKAGEVKQPKTFHLRHF